MTSERMARSEQGGRVWSSALRLGAALLCLGAGTGASAEPLPLSSDAVSSEAASSGGGGMVAASVAPAVPVGVQVLERGGNAVDAAIATGLAIGCAHQFSSGIGGGGFALVWDASARRAYALDARETAPAATVDALYQGPDGKPDPASIREGGRAVAVPSLVQGFEQLHRRLGRLAWADVVLPAAELCRRGVPVSEYHHRILALEFTRALLSRYPETARIQSAADGQPLAVGALLVQADLARSYQRIAQGGAAALQHGPLADALVDAARAHGGVLSQSDLAAYQPVWREPVRGQYRGLQVISMPPPSSGGAHVIQMLNTLEPFDLRRSGSGSARTLHWLGEAMKLAFADRALLLGDPDFVPVPLAYLVSPSYGRELARRIAPPFWTRPPWRWGKPPVLRVRTPAVRPPDDSGTAHVSVVDAQGNAVSLTQTVNTFFGSGITAPGTGIVLNNEMDDFALAPGVPNFFGLVGSRANAVQAGKRPLSSMSPTFVVQDGQLLLALGSPQGPRIITTVLQTLLNVVDFGMTVQQAVAAPRIHHQWQPDQLLLEAGVAGEVAEQLRAWGHPLRVDGGTFGISVAIRRDPESGRLEAGVDARGDAGAAAAVVGAATSSGGTAAAAPPAARAAH